MGAGIGTALMKQKGKTMNYHQAIYNLYLLFGLIALVGLGAIAWYAKIVINHSNVQWKIKK